MARRLTLLVTGLGCMAVLSGCCTLFPSRCKGTPLSPREIVERMNATSAQVVALRGKVGVSVRAPGTVFFLPLDGRLLFQKPDLIWLELSKFGRSMVELGANEEEYWFWCSEPILNWPANTLGVGHIDRIEEGGGHGLVLRPDVVADALGVGYLIPTDPRLQALPEVYDDFLVLNYVRLVGPGLRLVKKAYLNRYTGRLSHTDYFAPDGERVLLLTFDAVRTVAGVELVKRVTLELPSEKATLRFDLSALEVNPQLSREPVDPFERREFPGATFQDLDAKP